MALHWSQGAQVLRHRKYLLFENLQDESQLLCLQFFSPAVERTVMMMSAHFAPLRWEKKKKKKKREREKKREAEKEGEKK